MALALCTFTFGYDALVIGSVLGMPGFVVQYAHTDIANVPTFTATDISVMTAVPLAGGLLGAWAAGFVADKYGRKNTLFLGCLLGVVGAVLQTAASHIAMFTVGRFIACKFHAAPKTVGGPLLTGRHGRHLDSHPELYIRSISQ